MTEPTIVCPSCKSEIKLTESLAAPMIEAMKRQVAERISKQESDIKQREAGLREQEARLHEMIADRVAAQVKEERGRIAVEEKKKAKLEFSTDVEQKSGEIADLRTRLEKQDEKLKSAQKAEAELLKKKREYEDMEREMSLTIQKGIQESLESVRTKAKLEAQEELSLKVLDKETLISQLKDQIDAMKRKAEQGSQQSQGETQELTLEQVLSGKFARDTIEPVPKGEFGGDILQRVMGPAGQVCGTILWESKRTAKWSDKWLSKLKNDQRAANADIAILVSQITPEHIATFDLEEGIWVTNWQCFVPVAVALRQSLIGIASVRSSADGQRTKMELIYEYLTGSKFRQRVEAIVDRFTEMHGDLDKEQKFMNKVWAKRRGQITSVLESTSGLYGDLQGIAGKSLPEIDQLDIKLLGDGADTSQSS